MNDAKARGFTVLSSYPKSGNTWLRAVIESLRTGGATIDINANMAGICPAADRDTFDRTMGIDAACLSLAEIVWARPEVWRRAAAGAQPQPWIKIHDALLPPMRGAAPLFPADAIHSVVYIARDPRDVAVSFGHHFGVDIDTAIACLAKADLFIDIPQQALPEQLPQFLGSWSAHVASWLDAPNLRLHVVRYEDMHATPEATFEAVGRFLGLDTSPEILRRAIQAGGFDALRAQEDKKGFRERDPTSKKFFRSGRAGGWQQALTPTQAAQIASDHRDVMERLGYGESPS